LVESYKGSHELNGHLDEQVFELLSNSHFINSEQTTLLLGSQSNGWLKLFMLPKHLT
jgi:hypothetical protein